MDAHDLQFEDETFDFVYGDAILHHLNMTPALDEIFRVLKPNGKILFVEPLDINPVGKLVRSLTKKARTADEQPLRLCDIAEIKKRFETHFNPSTLNQFCVRIFISP
jgi:ubiquinone/menaquinone biosynthesis C-methylase UbiE